MKLFYLLLAALLISGCWTKVPPLPDDIEELYTINKECVDEARKCYAQDDIKGAKLAAAKARAAYKKLKKLGEKGEGLVKAQTAYRIADAYAEKTYEKRRYKKILAGWKASGYMKARNAALVLVFKGLGMATELIVKGRLHHLPEKVLEKTKLAADLVEKLGGPQKKADGKPDWPAISKHCFLVAKEPPAELSIVVALGLVIAGKGDLALVELKDVSLGKLSGEKRDVARIVRAVALVLAKLEQLAEDEFEKLHNPKNAGLDNQIRGGLHLFMAGLYMKKLRFLEADKALARAVRACPNNSVVVYLTGERLAAQGKFEEANKSLQRAAAGTKQEWLAKQIAKRTRELRDNPQQMKPLVFDYRFVYKLVKAFLNCPSMKSKAASRLKEWLSIATRLSDEMWKQIPNKESLEKHGRKMWEKLPSWPAQKETTASQ